MEDMRPWRTFGPLAIVATACVAAILTHVALDVVGDLALAHDAYDDLPHASHGGTFSLGLASRAVRGRDRDVRAALASATGRSPWRSVAAVGFPIASALGASVWLGLRALRRSCSGLVAIVASIFADVVDVVACVSLSRPRVARATRFALVTSGNAGKRGPPSFR